MTHGYSVIIETLTTTNQRTLVAETHQPTLVEAHTWADEHLPLTRSPIWALATQAVPLPNGDYAPADAGQNALMCVRDVDGHLSTWVPTQTTTDPKGDSTCS